jgi:hypothetical protein
MSTPAIRNLAQQVQKLTYDEMMEVAEWFSHWTQPMTDDGEVYGTRRISADEMACNLSDWATSNLDE